MTQHQDTGPQNQPKQFEVNGKIYIKKAEIGSGLNGKVYEVVRVEADEKNQSSGPTLVLKQFPKFSYDSRYKEGIETEYRIMNFLYGNSDVSGDMLVRPMIHGKKVNSDFGTINFAQFLERWIDILYVYQFLQKNEIAHKDFRVENLLIDNAGCIYPIDFEVSKDNANVTELLKDIPPLALFGQILIYEYLTQQLINKKVFELGFMAGPKEVTKEHCAILGLDLDTITKFTDLCDEMVEKGNLNNGIEQFKALYQTIYPKRPLTIHHPKFLTYTPPLEPNSTSQKSKKPESNKTTNEHHSESAMMLIGIMMFPFLWIQTFLIWLINRGESLASKDSHPSSTGIFHHDKPNDSPQKNSISDKEMKKADDEKEREGEGEGEGEGDHSIPRSHSINK